MNCLECDNKTDNPKFCSRSCAAKYNNRKYPKREKGYYGKCITCNNLLLYTQKKYCSKYCQFNAPFVCKHGKSAIIKTNDNGKKFCAKCNYDYVLKWRRKTKRKLVSIFGGKCLICGYDKCVRALEFHHIKPKEKLFCISAYKNLKFSDLLEECKKCVLLCSNCHREVEDGLTKLPSSVV